MSTDLSSALAILRREIPELAGVYLFGSAADGTLRPDSDVDLAFYAGRPLERMRVLDLQEAIAKALKRDVDLIDLATAPTILQVQVIGEGRLLAALDADAVAFFEVRVIRDYYDLKARRAEIEADIVERGRVHAG
jgi:predicted nucleotidyltransferase